MITVPPEPWQLRQYHQKGGTVVRRRNFHFPIALKHRPTTAPPGTYGTVIPRSWLSMDGAKKNARLPHIALP
jgi:hypothetical protein